MAVSMSGAKNLVDVPEGAFVEAVHVEGGQNVVCHLASLGIIPGVLIEMRRSSRIGGPFIIGVRGTRIALGRGMAKRIMVR